MADLENVVEKQRTHVKWLFSAHRINFKSAYLFGVNFFHYSIVVSMVPTYDFIDSNLRYILYIESIVVNEHMQLIKKSKNLPKTIWHVEWNVYRIWKEKNMKTHLMDEKKTHSSFFDICNWVIEMEIQFNIIEMSDK